MDFFIYLVLFFVFLYLKNRIDGVEALVKRQQQKKDVVEPTPTPSVAPKPTEDWTKNILEQPMPQVQVSSNISPVPQSSPAPEYKAESVSFNEEAGGKWLGKIGAFALFIGVCFFLKYAFDNDLISPLGRVVIGLFAGIIMVGLGRFLRSKYLWYSDILMGGGIGILYLSTYASFAFYHLVDAPVAYLFVALVTVLSVIISLVDDTITLAALGILGGFLTPVLISYNVREFLGLFTYIFLLDLGVLLISFKNTWHKLNYIAFFGTLLLVSGWYSNFYTPINQAPFMLFISLYFLVFLVCSVAHHIFRKEMTLPPDILLITLNAFGYFGLSYAVLPPDSRGFFALLMALVYLIVSYLMFTISSDDKVLNFYLPGISIVFLSVAIPLQLTGHWITIAWLIESLVLFALARAVKSANLQVFGSILFALSLFHFFAFDTNILGGVRSLDSLLIFNYHFLFLIVAVVVSYVISSLVSKTEFSEASLVQSTKTAAIVFFVIAHLLTLYAITSETNFYFEQKIAAVHIDSAPTSDSSYPVNSYGGSASNTERSGLLNNQNISVSLVWILYAMILFALAKSFKSRNLQVFGFVLYGLGLFHFFFLGTGIFSAATLSENILIFNYRFLFLLIAVVVSYAIKSLLFTDESFTEEATQSARTAAMVFLVLAHLLTLYALSSEISIYFDQEINTLHRSAQTQVDQNTNYRGNDPYNYNQMGPVTPEEISIGNQKNITISIIWALYAAILMIIGFAAHVRALRIGSLILFFVTALKVFVDVWSLGPLYRIVSAIVFGIIALAASFLYAKFKHRIQEML